MSQNDSDQPIPFIEEPNNNVQLQNKEISQQSDDQIQQQVVVNVQQQRNNDYANRYHEKLQKFLDGKKQRQELIRAQVQQQETYKPSIQQQSETYAQLARSKVAEKDPEAAKLSAFERMSKIGTDKVKKQKEFESQQQQIENERQQSLNDYFFSGKPPKKVGPAFDEEQAKVYTFHPEISEMGKETTHDVNNVDFQLTWKKMADQKIQKLQFNLNAKQMVECTFAPNRVAKEKGEKLLKNNQIYQILKPEDRLFATAASRLQQFKVDASLAKEEEVPTFKPQICENSERMVKKERYDNVFESLYQLSEEKQRKLKETAADLSFTAATEQGQQQIADLYNQGYNNLQPVQHGREEDIYRRQEEVMEKKARSEAQRRLEEEEQRKLKLSRRSEQLAENRRKKVADGTFVSVRRSAIPQTIQQGSLVCEGSRKIVEKHNYGAPAYEKLYQYSKIKKQQAELKLKQSTDLLESQKYSYKPTLVNSVPISVDFQRRQQELIAKKKALLLQQKQDREDAEMAECTFKPNTNVAKNMERAKKIGQFVGQTPMSESECKTSAKFMERMKQSRVSKNQDQPLPEWKLEPTQQQPFDFSYQSMTASQFERDHGVCESMLKFLDVMDQEIEAGYVETDVLDQSDQLNTSTVELQGDIKYVPVGGDVIFTQYQKIFQSINYCKTDNEEYHDRRKQRLIEMKLQDEV